MSNKIGHTDGFVFSMLLQQYLFAPAMGDKLVMSAPHPDAPGGSRMTLSIVPCAGSAKVAPDVVEVLRALSRTTSAVGWGSPYPLRSCPSRGTRK